MDCTKIPLKVRRFGFFLFRHYCLNQLFPLGDKNVVGTLLYGPASCVAKDDQILCLVRSRHTKQGVLSGVLRSTLEPNVVTGQGLSRSTELVSNAAMGSFTAAQGSMGKGQSG